MQYSYHTLATSDVIQRNLFLLIRSQPGLATVKVT